MTDPTPIDRDAAVRMADLAGVYDVRTLESEAGDEALHKFARLVEQRQAEHLAALLDLVRELPNIVSGDLETGSHYWNNEQSRQFAQAFPHLCAALDRLSKLAEAVYDGDPSAPPPIKQAVTSDQLIRSCLEGIDSSNWIKQAVRDLLARDPVDAANDAGHLAGIFERRALEIAIASGAMSN